MAKSAFMRDTPSPNRCAVCGRHDYHVGCQACIDGCRGALCVSCCDARAMAPPSNLAALNAAVEAASKKA